MAARPAVLSRKLVIVGDGACGKTSLLSVYVQGTFPKVFILFIFFNYCLIVVF
jgi:GTPase SAR1 family protein